MGQLGDLSPQGSIAVGVLVGLISTSLQAIGLTLQRKSHLLEEEKYAYDLRRPPYRRRRWQLGMFMFVISNIVGSTIQITTLPLPVLSTLQASGLVFNTIFATLLLGEPFTRFSVLGTLLVCIGAVLIATFGAIGEPAHTLDQLLVLLARRPFLLWMGGTALIIGITLLGGRVLKTLSTPGKARGWIAKYGLPQTLSFHTPRIKVVRGVMYGSVSGILSAHSLLVAKSAVELLVRTIVDRVNQFNRWQSWVILLGLVALALTQLYYMHRGLKLCSTSILYPFVFCIYNIIAILDGLVYFHQASRLSGLHAGLIALGTVVLLSGVLCLSWRLEEVSGHPPAVGPTPTPLTPGMGIMEETASPPSYSDFVYPPDEEAHPHERQPLLSTPQHPHPPPHRHTLSHLRISPQHRRSTADASTEAAQIWAELDDDEADADILSALPLQSPSSARRSHRRHRSKSSATPFLSNRKTRHTSSGENGLPPSPSPLSGNRERTPSSASRTGGTWGTRQLPFLNRNVSRRTSAPIIHPPPRPRHRASSSSNTGPNRNSLDENSPSRSDLPPIADQDSTTNHNHDHQQQTLSSDDSTETQPPFLETWAHRLRRLRQWSSGQGDDNKDQDQDQDQARK